MPEQRQLYDYWVERASHGQMPRRCDISPAHVPRLLPYLSLIDVHQDTGLCSIRLAGTRLRDIYDREITGLCLGDIDFGDRRDYWMTAYRRTIDEGKPTQGVLRGPRVNKEHLVQYWLRLPLRKDKSKGVAMILCLDYLMSALDEEEGALQQHRDVVGN